MIMDEVKTGFRVAPGGAQELFGIEGDLSTYAKAMGNGYPIAAIGGKKEVMASVGPGRAAHGGTYCGNVVGTAAADATLKIIDEVGVLDTIKARGMALMTGIHGILTDEDIAHHMLGVPEMFGFSFGEEEPVDYRSWERIDSALYDTIIAGLLARGAMPEVGGKEPWFLCAALSEKDVDDTLSWFEEAVKEAKE
jgi:glutamate-1-semialdehyde 2,1-aminomutase